ncbi:hypothetical protein ABNF97_23300 [Plantactinospora sp. B6F1]|uniref:hypothetical protein n=1 Tax=Plantactinospora sp. B6F1 TaxID=3158971 RepID=UPI0032D8DA56
MAGAEQVERARVGAGGAAQQAGLGDRVPIGGAGVEQREAAYGELDRRTETFKLIDLDVV